MSVPPSPAVAPQEKAFDSAAYWRTRYREGGNSGAGSYGQLSIYKAHVVNELVHRRDLSSVVELGSGDGNQASLFDIPRYTGIDVAPKVVAASKERFADRKNWRFFQASSPRVDGLAPHDLALSLDVIYHLTEDDVFDAYMKRLFALADQYVLIYASDHDADAKGKHVRHRCYSDWIARNVDGWTAIETMDQPFPMTETSDPSRTSFAFFRLYARDD